MIIMNTTIPNWLIITSGVGQIFTAMIYPYIRHQVFDWYNDVKQLKPLNQETNTFCSNAGPPSETHSVEISVHQLSQ